MMTSYAEIVCSTYLGYCLNTVIVGNLRIIGLPSQKKMNRFTPPKTNMDTQNDGLEKVTPFKNGHYWYLSLWIQSPSENGNGT